MLSHARPNIPLILPTDAPKVQLPPTQDVWSWMCRDQGAKTPVGAVSSGGGIGVAMYWFVALGDGRPPIRHYSVISPATTDLGTCSNRMQDECPYLRSLLLAYCSNKQIQCNMLEGGYISMLEGGKISLSTFASNVGKFASKEVQNWTAVTLAHDYEHCCFVAGIGLGCSCGLLK